MTGLQIATVAMAVASIVISGMSVRWSLKSARILRQLEARRAQREAERSRERGIT